MYLVNCYRNLRLSTQLPLYPLRISPYGDAMPPQRFHHVDLLRGLAAFAVLVTHYQYLYLGFHSDAKLPLNGILWPLYHYGGFAVQLFWSLSGFVFAKAYSSDVPFRRFAVHRIARLYPLHFVTLLVVAALQAVSWMTHGRWEVYQGNDLPHFVLHLFFASNWFTTAETFNAPIWSVSVEVLVYFLFFAYLRHSKLWLASLLCVAGLAAQALSHNNIAQCTSMFFVGVLIARLPSVRLRWGVGLWLAMVAGCSALNALGHAASVPRIVLYVGCPLTLLMFISFDTSRRLSRKWRWIGAITYAVYLVHMPILIAMRLAFGELVHQNLASPGLLAIWLVTVILIAIPTHYLFEKPAQDWIRWLLLKDTPRSVS